MPDMKKFTPCPDCPAPSACAKAGKCLIEGLK